MNILKKVCLQEENQDLVCTALDVETYEALITVLIVDDVQVLTRRCCTVKLWLGQKKNMWGSGFFL